ncbi:MAG: GlsB/YeaQ/YmgE family stress response membrane protein [Rhizobiales bacterium]|nr:GlsB/YeaQ/YmgE family stress response membrane protein [Hyphomicrobiales bacterium]
MAIETIVIWLLVGGIAGWLAGLVIKGGGYGLLGNIVIGIIGAVVAGWLLPQLGILIGGGIVGAIINAFIGAVIVLFVIGLVKRA